MIGISGAMPNHPKKHRKKAIHDMWNARIGALVKSARRMLVALLRMVMSQFSSGRWVKAGSHGETPQPLGHPFTSAGFDGLPQTLRGGLCSLYTDYTDASSVSASSRTRRPASTSTKMIPFSTRVGNVDTHAGAVARAARPLSR